MSAVLLATQSYVSHRQADRQAILVAAVAFVEAAVDTAQGVKVALYDPKIDPSSQPGNWTLSGLAVAEHALGSTHGTPVTAELERLCPSATPSCWHMKEFRVAGVVTPLSRRIANDDPATSRQDTLDRLASSLKQELADRRESHRQLMDRYSEFARIRAETLADAIAGTGLDADLLVARHAESKLASGGPLIPAGDAIAGPYPGLERARAVTGFDPHWNRLFALQALFRRLPIAAPMTNYTISSYFGLRVDPLTGRRALHNGIDLVAPLGASVLATAPGIVSFAGEHGRYGNLVEIRHGYGLSTRYGHLSEIFVGLGQPVAQGQAIGIMGTSGRSTGPHLHYEVRSRDRALDPLKFLQAGAAAARRAPEVFPAEADGYDGPPLAEAVFPAE